MELLAAGADGWDEARAAWNLSVDQWPAAVAQAESVEDVVAAVAHARENGLRVAPQATGHGAGALGPLDDALLLKTTGMDGIEVDPDARSARVEAGALAGELVVRAAEHGLAPLTGSAVDVGVVGFTLGGGLGWLARSHGLACNAVKAAEVVTAAGEVVRADADNEPDLFWALRGGGGAFAVVTAVEVELHPVDEVFGGALVWPAERGEELLETYRGWAEGVPERLTSVVRFLNLPPLPFIPEPVRGKHVLSIDAAYLGDAAEGEELIAPLRAAGGTVMDTFGPIEVADLGTLHGDPEQPTPGRGNGFLLRELDADAVKAFASVGGPGSGSPLIGLELRHLGGALATEPPGAGALPSLEGHYALYGVGALVSPEAGEAIDAHLDAVAEAMAPWTADRNILNFAERASDTGDTFSPETYQRLREVKARYDADDLIRSNHPVPPLASR